jgi:hypothetical protein
MDELARVGVLIAFLTFASVVCYGGITLIGSWRRRLERGSAPPLSPEDLDAIHARLAATEALEGRVAELEERLDFAERLLAHQREPAQLPAPPNES